MAYPVTWFGVPMTHWLPITEVATTVLLSVVTLSGLGWIQWRVGGSRNSILPWLWVLIASAPAILLLSFPYLQAAPRVLMLSSVGILWLWVDFVCLLPQLLGRYTQSANLIRVVTVGLFCLLFLQSIIYIRQQMRTYKAGSALIWDIVEKTEVANQADQVAVFINLPTWLALPRSYFAIGEEGLC